MARGACAAQDKAIKALTAALAPKAKALRNGKMVSVRPMPRQAGSPDVGEQAEQPGRR